MTISTARFYTALAAAALAGAVLMSVLGSISQPQTYEECLLQASKARTDQGVITHRAYCTQVAKQQERQAFLDEPAKSSKPTPGRWTNLALQWAALLLGGVTVVFGATVAFSEEVRKQMFASGLNWHVVARELRRSAIVLAMLLGATLGAVAIRAVLG